MNSFMREMPISFPGLFPNFEINIDPVALHIGHGIYWYGIIIALGFLMAVVFCTRRAHRYGIQQDDLYDLLIIATPLSIIGARLYYVIFYLDLFRNPDGGIDFGRAVAIWDGGLAIYGGVIAAVLTAIFVCRYKKISVGAMLDLGCMGLLIGQMVGRWGIFINREAFGGETTLPWRMRLWESADHLIEVHPTFFYESLWNLIGLLLIVFVIEKYRNLMARISCSICSGMGWDVHGSKDCAQTACICLTGQFSESQFVFLQMLSVVLCIAALFVMIYQLKVKKPSRENLYVNRIKARGDAESGN